MEATIEKVRSMMSGLKVPQHYDKVFKDECAFTFDTPFSDGGLAVNLKTWQAFGNDMLPLDVQRNGGQGCLYLLQKFRRVPKEKPAEGAEPSKLAIGVAGGFLEDKWEVQKEHELLLIDASGTRSAVPLPCTDLPMIVSDACEAVISHQGARSMDATSRWDGDGQDGELKESKYAKDLVQLPAAKKISPHPKDWVCEKSGDTQNLWLNLSDGHIGGGRRFWDGSGGSNGALDHFAEEKERGNFFPLAVKLGTITAEGADVYSYAPDEDGMVKDPYLAKHLEHWGIDIMKLEKTDKTLAEMEVEMNLTYDWSRICESGSGPLVRLRGPGLVGLKNLGNSCYMNSTIQLVLGLPEAKARYFDADCAVRCQAPADAPNDLVTQVAKLTNGLHSDRYAPPWHDEDDEDDPKLLVAPHMFRSIIGKRHRDFASGRQQDASEFLQYFLDQLSRAERTALGSRLQQGKPLEALFQFQMEERYQEAGGEKRVKYSNLQHNMLGVPVKLEDADNLNEVTAYRAAHPESGEKEAKKAKTEGEVEEPKPVIQLQSCLARLVAPEDGVAWRGSSATKTSRIATMPRYLLFQLQRYYVDETWQEKKLDCLVPMPDTLSLEEFRGKGLQDGETLMPEDSAGGAAAATPAGPEPDPAALAQLLSMGIPENGAKRACLAVQNANAEMACAWYFEHAEDPDVNDPLPAPGSATGGGPATSDAAADPEALAMLSSMGFSEKHVKAALKACGNNAERAGDWLFSHADDLDGALAAMEGGPAGAPAGGAPAAADFDDGKGDYTLLGFVSHIGKQTSHGHYVCHMKRGENDGWVIFDDQKVAKSESPPLDLGYIYLYRRNDVKE